MTVKFAGGSRRARRIAGGSTALVMSCLLVPGISFAQSDDGLAGEAQLDDTQSEVSEAGELQLGKLIVTAQKREQSVQDIGFSIKALSGEDARIFGVVEPKDLAAQTPGLFAKTTVGDSIPTFTMRGIGLNDFVSNNNSPTSLYVDDIYLPFAPMAGFALFDIGRVEVLKGPQGTLYGRNNTGGAIKFVQNRPTDTFEGSLRVDYGRFDLVEVEGAVSGPISEKLNGRIALFTRQGGAWQTGQITGAKLGDADRIAGRAMLDWFASDTLDISIEVHGGRENGTNRQVKLVNSQDPSNPFVPCSQAPAGGLVFDGSCTDLLGFFEASSDIRATSGENASFSDGADNNSYGYGGSLRVTWDLGGATLTSITGYDAYERREGLDADGSPFVLADGRYTDSITSFSQEVRAASSGDSSLDWIVGAYLSSDEIDLEQVLRGDDLLPLLTGIPAPIDAVQGFRQETKSYALFGSFDLALDDQWSVVGGLRASYEERDFAGGSTFVTALLGNVPLASTDDSIDNRDLSGELGVNFRPNDDLLLYVRGSKGFKSGGFNAAFASSPLDLAPFDPETLWALEAGWKATLLGGAMTLNGAGYAYDWKDFQAQIVVLDPDLGLPNQVLSNAGDARIFGFELDSAWAVTDAVSLGASLNWIDAEVVSGQLDGRKLANTPEFQVSGYGRYEDEIGTTGWSAFAHLDFSYRTEVDFRLNSATGWSIQEGYALANARIGLTAPNQKTSIDLWVRNLTDEEYLVDTFEQLPINVLQVWGAPRTFGVSLRQAF